MVRLLPLRCTDVGRPWGTSALGILECPFTANAHDRPPACPTGHAAAAVGEPATSPADCQEPGHGARHARYRSAPLTPGALADVGAAVLLERRGLGTGKQQQQQQEEEEAVSKWQQQQLPWAGGGGSAQSLRSAVLGPGAEATTPPPPHPQHPHPQPQRQQPGARPRKAAGPSGGAAISLRASRRSAAGSAGAKPLADPVLAAPPAEAVVASAEREALAFENARLQVCVLRRRCSCVYCQESG